MEDDTLGARIKRARIEKGLKMKEVADLIGTSQGHLSNIENGHKEPGSSMIISLKECLGLSSDYILTGKDPHIEKEVTNKKPALPPSLSIRSAAELMLNLEKLSDKEIALVGNFIKTFVIRSGNEYISLDDKKTENGDIALVNSKK